MFDPKTKQAWQSIGPEEALRDRILSQQPKKVVPFSRTLLKTAASVAACLVIAVYVLGLGTPLVEANGQPVNGALSLSAARGTAREVMALALDESFTVKLTAQAGVELTVSGGTLEDGLWTVDGPGEYVLWAKKGNRTQTYLLSFDAESGLWTLCPAS